jgi:hypothetical protein
VSHAAHWGNLEVVQCLIKELGADVNHAVNDGCMPLYAAAQAGHLEMVRFLIVKHGADVNIAIHGSTPLMMAADKMHHKVVRLLLKLGANSQALHSELGTDEADTSKRKGAPSEETAYLHARTHCANPSCSNAGLKECERCLQVYFCGSACIRAHWPAHKAECKAAAAKLKATEGTPRSASSSSSFLILLLLKATVTVVIISASLFRSKLITALCNHHNEIYC